MVWDISKNNLVASKNVLLREKALLSCQKTSENAASPTLDNEVSSTADEEVVTMDMEPNVNNPEDAITKIDNVGKILQTNGVNSRANEEVQSILVRRYPERRRSARKRY